MSVKTTIHCQTYTCTSFACRLPRCEGSSHFLLGHFAFHLTFLTKRIMANRCCNAMLHSTTPQWAFYMLVCRWHTPCQMCSHLQDHWRLWSMRHMSVTSPPSSSPVTISLLVWERGQHRGHAISDILHTYKNWKWRKIAISQFTINKAVSVLPYCSRYGLTTYLSDTIDWVFITYVVKQPITT